MWLQLAALVVLLDTARRLTRLRCSMYHPQAAQAWLVFTAMLALTCVLDVLTALQDPTSITTLAGAARVGACSALWVAVTLSTPGAVRSTLARTRASDRYTEAAQQ